MNDKHYGKSRGERETTQKDRRWKPSPHPGPRDDFRGETETNIAYTGDWKNGKKAGSEPEQ